MVRILKRRKRSVYCRYRNCLSMEAEKLVEETKKDITTLEKKSLLIQNVVKLIKIDIKLPLWQIWNKGSCMSFKLS